MEFSGLDLHPFVTQQTGSYMTLPPQTVPLREKMSKDGTPTKWGKACMNMLARIARIQFEAKRKLKINYQLVNGEFVASEYRDTLKKEEYDLLQKVEDDMPIPSFVKNYDIISQPFNTMIGELLELPDIFLVEGKGEELESDKLALKKQMLTEWVKTSIKEKALTSLLQRGIDPEDPNALQNEEQAQAIQEELASLEKQMTPPEIERHLKSNYRHLVEEWADKELQDMSVRFNLKKMQRVEFSDYLIAGERYRHIYTDAFGLRVETLNPCYVFSHKAPETEYIQDGDYQGFIEFLPVDRIIDKYGYLMTKDQILELQKPWKDVYKNSKLGYTADGTKIDYLHQSGLPYQVNLPTKNREFNENAPWMDKMNPSAPMLDEVQMQQMTGSGSLGTSDTYGMAVVVNGYWMSQKKIGKLFWINPVTKQPEKILVDESVYIPKYIKEVQSSILFTEEDEINTITWTYANEGWQGKVIDNYYGTGLLSKPIYLGIKPNDLQFKGELFIYNAKLPIAGQYCNNRNTKITSYVDRLKNLQFFYNILMNQCFHFFQTEILPFVLIDPNMLPKTGDWAGNNKLEKWIDLAQKLGVTVGDTSPMNMNGANMGGQLPKEIDLDRGNRVLARWNLAESIKRTALYQAGISEQRLGDVKSSETATGINESISRSYTQTSSWFETFFECEQTILQMALDAAQYLQSKKKDLGNLLINSSYTNSLMKVNNNDFNLYQIHVYVLKSQEEKRKLEFAKRMAIENNTVLTPMSERILMGTSNDLKSIVSALREGEELFNQQQQQKQQLEQQSLGQQQQQHEERLAQEKEQFYAELQNKLDVATINSFGFSKTTGQDTDGNGVSDMIEFYNSRIKAFDAQNRAKMEENKMAMQQQDLQNKEQARKDELIEKQKDRENGQLLADKKLAGVKIAADKTK